MVITGFQWLFLGGSDGDLVGLQVPKTANPSSGTFAPMSYKFQDTIDGPQPTCSIIPYLWFCQKVVSPSVAISPSVTHTGVFCNNEYIVSTAKDCVGNGIPVSYQTFSQTITVPSGTTVISIQAIGTAEPAWMISAGYGTYNIMIHNNGG